MQNSNLDSISFAYDLCRTAGEVTEAMIIFRQQVVIVTSMHHASK